MSFVKSYKTQGGTEIARRLRRIASDFPATVGQSLVEELKIELREVVYATPLRTGALRDSERVTPYEIHGHVISASIVAGGPTAPYALFVHEDLDAFHEVGGPKFIERPLNASAPFMGERVGKRIKTKLERM